MCLLYSEHAHHHGPTVGKYSVDLASFESTALPTLVISPDTPTSSRKTTVIVIDEIGKMELFSKSFSSAVRNVFRLEGVVILATIPIARGKPLPLVEELRKNEKCTVIEVQLVVIKLFLISHIGHRKQQKQPRTKSDRKYS